MAQAFTRTTRALADDSQLWPLSFVICGLIVLCAWVLWFAAAGLPTYAASRDVRLDGPPRLSMVQTTEGSAVRYQTRQVWPLRAVFPPGVRSQLERGQQAIVRIDAPDGTIRSLPAKVTDAQGLSGGPGTGLNLVSAEDMAALLPAATRVEARVVIGRQSPLQRLLAGSGLGVTTTAVTSVSQRP